ncbi:MAG: OmpA family protein [Treponema sp.]|nr:OmpA family protein [Treponema sp.]
MYKKIYTFTISLFLFSQFFYAQGITLSYTGSSNYILTERTDLRRYDNNKYIGLMSREVKSFIVPREGDGKRVYEGDFYVEQDTVHVGMALDEGIHDAITSIFSIDDDGIMEMYEDNGYPSFRSFPSFPQDKEIKKGDTWTSAAERAVDPTGEGIITRMPIYVQYTYNGQSSFNGKPVHYVKALWATRYGTNTKYIDLDGDPNLKTASGKHEASIYLDIETGAAVLIRDVVDEEFIYKDGKKIAYKGTISLFTEYPSSVDTQELMPIINRLVKEADIDYKEVDAGLMLVIRDLQFVANKAELLPGEEKRLDQIASLLKKVPDNQILVEGHTARVGDESDELGLSLDRAHTIVKELTARGVSKNQFITKGSGGTKPVADNDTPEGRARNRRVEITILK